MDETHEADLWWVPISAAFLPFLVWPVEVLLPWPFVIEEVGKAWLAWQVAAKGAADAWWKLGLAIGVLFGGSELLLYVVNAILVGNFRPLWLRLGLTAPMHVVTVLVISWWAKKGFGGLVIGTFLGIAIHFGFNYFVA